MFGHNLKMIVSPGIKPVVWIGSAKADLTSFPEDVKDAIGNALYVAQRGGSTLALSRFAALAEQDAASRYGEVRASLVKQGAPNRTA